MTNSFLSRILPGPIALMLALLCGASSLHLPAAEKPLRILLVTGGCCHDYAKQKDALKKGLEARAHLLVDQVHTDDKSTRPPLAILGHPGYAEGYDLVIHDECASDISDPETIQGVLKPHQNGIPAVTLHCAMHSFRIGNPNTPVEPGAPRGGWFEFLGLQSSGHGPQKPIEIAFVDQDHPAVKGLEGWTTIDEELYNNVQIFKGTRVLARGKQTVPGRDGAGRVTDFAVVWTNEYGANKTRVFSTTLGHNSATVEDARYLDLVVRGVLWATGHLNDDGSPAKGYGPGGK